MIQTNSNIIPINQLQQPLDFLNLFKIKKDSEDTALKYEEQLISQNQIRRYAAVIWKMQGNEEPTSFRHIPKNQSMLGFGYGNLPNVNVEDQKFILKESFVLPIFHISTKAGICASTVIGISFIKDGLYRLMKKNIADLGFEVPVNMEVRIGELRQTIANKSLSIASETIEQFLLTEMYLEPGPQGFEKAIEMIEESRGCMSINQVCAEAGISERGLQRHFNERIGISPKKFSKITRVNAYLSELLEKESYEWMERVVSFNYHDQPHLINEFKSIIKLSPRDLLKYRDSLYHQAM